MNAWSLRARRAAIVATALSLSALAVHAQGRGDYGAGPKGAGDPTIDSPAASAQASAALLEPKAAPVDGRKPWVPDHNVEPTPTTESPAPTREEWATAPMAREARITQPGCVVQRLREWYRVGCPHVAIQLIAGTRAGTDFGKRFATKETSFPEEVWTIFPARKGDRRFFEVFRFAKWGVTSDAEISEHWLEGEPTPRITVQGYRWGI